MECGEIIDKTLGLGGKITLDTGRRRDGVLFFSAEVEFSEPPVSELRFSDESPILALAEAFEEAMEVYDFASSEAGIEMMKQCRDSNGRT